MSTKITNLQLADNRIKDIAAIANMTLLSYVEMQGNKIRNIFPLHNAQNPRYINLQQNEQIACEDLTFLESRFGTSVVQRPQTCLTIADSDEDFLENDEDNCPYHYNPYQTNTDGQNDGGDACDLDDDNDGVPDSEDDMPLDSSESKDSDGDGIGNNADSDDDNDGVEDPLDAFPLDGSESADFDGDGIGNNADNDDDNDGVEDLQDAFPFDATEHVDTDRDGIGNNADNDDDNDGVQDNPQDAFPLDSSESVDSDGDGIGNNSDPDADDDNDGVNDEAAYGFDPLGANSIPTVSFEGWMPLILNDGIRINLSLTGARAGACQAHYLRVFS